MYCIFLLDNIQCIEYTMIKVTTDCNIRQKGEEMYTETTAYIEKSEAIKKENEAIDKFFKNLEEEGIIKKSGKQIHII